jgi:uncharacterized protein (DUF1501 family)
VLNRREFLGVVASSGAVLAFPRLGWTAPPPGARRLVLIHLRGGNDGLNTVIPFTDPRYRELRPTLAIDRSKVLDLEGGLGLHPGLGGFRKLWKTERLAIVNGVGYPKPNYSHFRSTEIWYTAQPEKAPTYGWIGRALDARSSQAPLRALALAKEKPLSFVGGSGGTVTLTEFSRFRVPTGLGGVVGLYGGSQELAGQLGQVGRAGTEAFAVANTIARLTPASGPFYGPLGNQLRKVISLLRADLPLEVIQLDQGGFDTHSNQAGGHNGLLTALGNNLNAYQEHLERLGLADSVVTVVFSEFGRRAEENISGGTDHGSAGPVFVLGKGIRPGFHGDYPSLDDLDRGNFKYTTDFRRVYASLLKKTALDQDPTPLLGAFEPLELFA